MLTCQSNVYEPRAHVMVLLHWVWMRTRVAERVQDADDVAEVEAVVEDAELPPLPLVRAPGVLRAADRMRKAVPRHDRGSC